MGFNLVKIPKPKSSFCSAVNASSFVIDPEGCLYKCWAGVGNEKESSGHLNDLIQPSSLSPAVHPNTTKWLRFDPFSHEDCRTCKVLPLCLGGCPDAVVNQNAGMAKNCETWKYNLKEIIRLIALNRMDRRNKTASEGKPKYIQPEISSVKSYSP